MCDDARGWATRFVTSINKFLTGIINPHYKFVQRWTKLFASWLVIFIDPLFLFLIKVKEVCLVLMFCILAFVYLFHNHLSCTAERQMHYDRLAGG